MRDPVFDPLRTTCPIATDNLTRQLYATDASIYQVEPLAVAFPRSPDEVAAAIRASVRAGIQVIPRGAGTGLVGGALGPGLVIDLARHNRTIDRLDLEGMTVRVGAGVVLDQLNAFLKPHRCCFGPDVATGSRATLGGMIANNSSGARVPVYGTTADHLVSVRVVLPDGRIETVGRGSDGLRAEAGTVDAAVRRHAAAISSAMPPGLLKRWPGYGLGRWLARPGSLTDILAGSEGTLGAIVSAELKLVPIPESRGMGLLFFDSIPEAMAAAVELRDLKPAAVEHIDRILFDQTRGQKPFQGARDLLELDASPCESILIVEFHGDVEERLVLLEKRRLGSRRTMIRAAEAMNLVWALRKAGLSILTGRKGSAKPTTCIEDAAVRPEQLPDYVAGLRGILDRRGLEACFYGHAAAGLLHVRPVLDLHTPEGVRLLREVSGEVSALVLQFKGSLAAEHGVGIARTEFMREQFGDEVAAAMRSIKRVFDPDALFNPGKIVPVDQGSNEGYRIDERLRSGPDRDLKLPFEPVLAFAARDGSFVGNLEQCNGCGGCRKATPTMCPTFAATGDEIMSTRGRANTIRAVLEMRGDNAASGSPLVSADLEAALAPCLACRACTSECPSNVNLSLLKAELLHARHRMRGISMRERLIGNVDGLGRLGCAAPGLFNRTARIPWIRRWLERTIGLASRRPLPEYSRTRFDRWFRRRSAPPDRARGRTRGRVILWDDTFVRYHEPRVGIAAVRVLESAGFEVVLPSGRRCCGRPAFSQGLLDSAAAAGRHNLNLLSRGDAGVPIVFLEPSCHSMFAEDYRELHLPNAPAVAERSHLFESFIEGVLSADPTALRFAEKAENVAVHTHCHAKALENPQTAAAAAFRLPGRTVHRFNTGCCGMAGAFGAMERTYDLSLKVAEPLVRMVNAQPADTRMVASGTSCRHQIGHLTHRVPLHMAELLAQALEGADSSAGVTRD